MRLFCLCASLVLSLPLCAQERDQNAALQQQVQNKIASFQGHVSLFAKNLRTGASFGVAADEPVRTASTIKLAIMAECFHQAAAGKLQWDERLTLTKDEKVSGSGVLTEFSDGVQLPIRDLMHLMIVVSDNTATNLILNRVGGNAVNAEMAALGFEQTRVMRKILGDGNDLKPVPSGITTEGARPENKKFGLGRTTPHEMVRLLEAIYHGTLVDKASSDEMLAVLKRQQDHNGIGRDLKDITIASKSGALDHLRSDVALVYSRRGPIAIAITADDMPDVFWSPDNPAELLLSSLSEMIVNGL